MALTLQEFSDGCHRTSTYTDDAISHGALIAGFAEEAGEVAGLWKRLYRDNGGAWSQELKRKMALEVADCMWYGMAIIRSLGYTPDEVANMLFEKLNRRAANGTLHGEGSDR